MSAIFFKIPGLTEYTDSVDVYLLYGIADYFNILKGFCAYLAALHFSPVTVRKYVRMVRNVTKTVDYHDLTPRIIRAFLRGLMEHGTKIEIIRHYISAVKRFYRYARDKEGSRQNFSQIINMQLPRVPRKLPNFLLEEEMFEFLAKLGYKHKSRAKHTKHYEEAV
jgi:site-specific recombinase XerD